MTRILMEGRENKLVTKKAGAQGKATFRKSTEALIKKKNRLSFNKGTGTTNVTLKLVSNDSKVNKHYPLFQFFEFSWTDIAIIGEKPEVVEYLKKGSWDFAHLEETVYKISETNPGCDIFLAGGSPQPYSLSPGVTCTCPNICAFIVPSGSKPPELVALQDFQHGTDEIHTMRQFGLTWDPFPLKRHLRNSIKQNAVRLAKVYMLKSKLRKVVLKTMHQNQKMALEYLTLFTMKPNKEWKRKPNGELEVSHACFSYDIGGGDIVDEEFDKEQGHRLKSFIPDFCQRYDLQEDIHYDSIEEAIRVGFEKVRKEKEERIKLLKDYPEEVLDNIRVVKIFPRDDCVETKISYVNKYYGNADWTV